MESPAELSALTILFLLVLKTIYRVHLHLQTGGNLFK